MRTQLLAIGFSSRMIERRVESGRLRVLHRGVYVLGPVLGPGGRELAAVFACGPHAYASHHTAALLHHLPLPAQPDSIHLTVVGRQRRPRSGIAIHRTRSLGADEHQIMDRVPLTTPARTALDLASRLEIANLEHLLAEAQGRNHSTLDQVHVLLARYPRRPGTGTLRALLDAGDPARAHLGLERAFLALIRRSGLPRPETNAKVHGHEVDVVWREQRVAVELDSQAWHAARPARERDSRRDQELILRGWAVLRVTHYQVTSEPVALVARVAATLARRGAGAA